MIIVIIEGDDSFTVQPVMMNPFDPSLIHWLICPMRQAIIVISFTFIYLENMINTFFSSEAGETKDFKLHEISFKLKSISNLWERECQKLNHGETRMVHK